MGIDAAGAGDDWRCRRLFSRCARWAEAARLTLPSVLLTTARGSATCELVRLAPPIRSTALAELRRGVAGDPAAWIAATGIAPRSLADLALRPATIQDKWFARLYLIKALIIVTLVIFWMVSGLIALTVSFGAAAAILSSHGFPRRWSRPRPRPAA